MPSSDKKNYVIAFLLCTTLGGAAMVMHTRQQLAEARKAPTLQVTRTEIKTAAAPAPLVAPPTPAAPTAETAPPELASERPEGPPSGQNRGQRGAQFAAQMAELMKDPEFAAAWKLEQEARVEQRYGALFKQLNLPPDQLAALKTLLAERENAGREVFASAAAQGMNPRDNRDELRQLTADLQAEVDGNIKARLGESVVAAINDYNSSSAQRSTVKDLSDKLSYTGQSLNDSQARQLTKILAETGTRSRNNTLVTDATLTRAAAVLTNHQLEALKALKAQQEAQKLLEEKTRAARDAAGGGGGGWGNFNGGGGQRGN